MIRRWLAGPLLLLALLLLTLLPAAPAAAEGGGPTISAAVATAAAPARTLYAPITAPALHAFVLGDVLQPAVVPVDGVYVALRSRPYNLPWALSSPAWHRTSELRMHPFYPHIRPQLTRIGETAGRNRLPIRTT